MKTAKLMRHRTSVGRFHNWTMPAFTLLSLILALQTADSYVFAGPAQTVEAVSSAEKPAAPAAAAPGPAVAADKPAVPPRRESAAKTAEPAATPEAELSEKRGIQVLSTRLTAAGCMIDFRYRVLDPEKAGKLSDPHVHPYIIDEASGAKFIVPAPPKVGQLRNTRKPVADKDYFILFANPANYIKSGSKVSVVIGDLKLERLTVE